MHVHRAWWLRLVMLLVLLVSFGPGLVGHVRHSCDPGMYSDDALQQIWPFLKYHDPQLFKHDYIARYYLDCMPIGFKALYITAAQCMDPRILSKILPYALYLILILTIARIAWSISGEIGMWCSLFLLMGISGIFSPMVGGLPRSFAYPMLALMLLALVESRPILLAILILLCSMFYPVVAVIGGITLACWLLLLDRKSRWLSLRWGLGKRVGLVGTTGLICIVLILPTLQSSSQFGSRIGADEVGNFPELQHGGRYNITDSYPFESTSQKALNLALSINQSRTTPWPVVGFLALDLHLFQNCSVARATFCFFWLSGLLICLIRIHQNPIYSRLIMLLFVCLLLYALSRYVYPALYMPGRYLEYTFPLLQILLLPLAPVLLGRWVSRRFEHLRIGQGVAAVSCVLIVLVVAQRGSETTGFLVNKVDQLSVMKWIQTLPPDVQLAGWFYQPIVSIPYVCQRSVLTSFEVHQVFHRSYALEMRERTIALINAYYAYSVSDVVNLRERMGVSHLLIHRGHLLHQARYFQPYDNFAQERFNNSQMRQLLAGPLKSAIVYEDRFFFLLDLRRVSLEMDIQSLAPGSN